MYHVIIIEDDPMVASINKQYIEVSTNFRVEHLFKNGAEALPYIKTNPVDLVILDYYTPVMNGGEFLDALHAAGLTPYVIMVTSADDAATIESFIRLGVTDYLIKPFGYERFQLALKNFCDHWDTIHQDPNHPHKFTQNQLDNVLLHLTASSPPPAPGGMPKGLQSQTLTLLQDYLKENPQGHTCDDIASHVGLSVVTVRRYMNYLAEQHLVDSDMDYNTGGRPCIVYKLKP